MLRYSSVALSSQLLLIRMQSEPVYRFIVEERNVDVGRAREATYVPVYASEQGRGWQRSGTSRLNSKVSDSATRYGETR